jgi:hypothetical protein
MLTSLTARFDRRERSFPTGVSSTEPEAAGLRDGAVIGAHPGSGATPAIATLTS